MSEVADRLKIVLAGSAGLGTGAVAMCGWGIGAALDARYGISMGGALWGALGAGIGLIFLGTVALRPAFEPGMWRLVPSVSLSMLGTTFLIGPGGSSGFPLVPPGSPWSMEAAWSLFLHGENALTPFGWSLFALSAVSFLIAVGGLGWTARLFENWQRELSGGTGAEKYRSKSGVFGNARLAVWNDIKDSVEMGRRDGYPIGEDSDPRKNSKIFNPENPKTWGMGGKGELIRMSGKFQSGHMLVYAGSGMGKTSAIVIPTLLDSDVSAITGDPEGAALNIVRGPRAARGKKIREIKVGHGFDVLKLLEPWLREDPTVYVDLAEMIVDEHKMNESDVGGYFKQEGINVIAALLEHFVNARAEKPLVEVIKIIAKSQENFKDAVSRIAQNYQEGTRTNLSLGSYESVDSRFYTSFSNTVRQALDWTKYPDYLAVATVEPEGEPEILHPDTDVFITMSTRDMTRYPGLMRIIFGAISFCASKGAMGERLVIVDEAAALGRMKVFETILREQRKKGVRLALIYQSEGQLREAYGPGGADSWTDGVAARLYSGVEAGRNLEELSRLIGNYTAEVASNSRSTSARGFGISSQGTSKSDSVSPHKVALIPPDDLRALPLDGWLIFFRGLRPMVITKAFWFRRKEWVALVERFR
ncbi:type IV secretory system conjugative DNA transfer family protein [Solirhodobacter olei]|uniref:type IV secretory system conjugative DNA transfer family protein n=1 Tax=Solirhodobacter olei TaxID=2493082 RepID=UPI000FDAA132|nr:type IV secretory system conjugative DNA transfer family protein [Solirhodobacter olei]